MKNRIPGIKAVLGLGNPDSGYKNTYHNAGKLFANYLAETLGADNRGFRASPSGLFETEKADKTVLIKPLNYMNENGKVARLALKSSGAKAENLLVAHDDSDLKIGEYKISFGRGSAGHRGVQSVIENLGTKNFWRLRIGIRPSAADKRRLEPQMNADVISANQRGNLRKSALRMKAGDFVLKKIAVSDRKILDSVFEKAAEELFGSVTPGQF